MMVKSAPRTTSAVVAFATTNDSHTVRSTFYEGVILCLGCDVVEVCSSLSALDLKQQARPPPPLPHSPHLSQEAKMENERPLTAVLISQELCSLFFYGAMNFPASRNAPFVTLQETSYLAYFELPGYFFFVVS